MPLLLFFKIFISLLIFVSILVLVVFLNYNLSLKHHVLIFRSDCECKKDIKIYVINQDKNGYEVKVEKSKKTIKTYFIQNIDKLNLKCNIFNSLKRGKNQKVIGYSLYGKSKRYYNYLTNLTYLTQKLYPNWVMKVYHDDSILESVKCEIECLKDEDNNLIDNTDFCDVKKLPVSIKNSKAWSAEYIHNRMWRWLPIGDDFVDIFSSRDLDSILQQREVDSVNFWMKSKKPGHIMRGK